MKRTVGLASYLAQAIKAGGNSAMDAETLIQTIYGVLSPVLKEAFQPIKQGLLDGTSPAVVSQGWGLLCGRLSQGAGFEDIYYWEAWDLFLGGGENPDCGILAEFKRRIINVLQETQSRHPQTGAVSTLYHVLDKSPELQSMSYILNMMATVRDKDGCPTSPVPAAGPLSALIDCLLNKLVRGGDHEVFHLFNQACGLTKLTSLLASVTNIEAEPIFIVNGHDGLKWPHSRFVKSNDLPLSPILNPPKAYKICLLESELPPARIDNVAFLVIPADSRIDMKGCSFPTKTPLILSADGLAELPEDLFLKDGEIAVLGVPVENVIPPKGYKLVLPIDSLRFQYYYQNRKRSPENAKIDARHYVFSDKINLTGISPDLFDGHSHRYLLQNADTQHPLGIRWYNELISECHLGRMPVSKLREFGSPCAMDLREYPLAMLPLPLQIPSPRKPKQSLTEFLDYQRSGRENDLMLKWLKKGFHLINQQGWSVLWRQGVQDFSAFIFDRARDWHRHYNVVELDLRETHPTVMMTLPATSDTPQPLGLESYYCESLTRDYQIKEHKRLAILTLGLSLLFFYICYCLRKSLIKRLPEPAQPEVAQILASFKWRPITRVASDYLNYKFSQQEPSLGQGQRKLLFGSLPEKNSARYFESMRYFPLFQTYRALNRFIRKTQKGSNEQKEAYETRIKKELKGLKPWLDVIKTEEELHAKNKQVAPLLFFLVLQVAKNKKLKKEFIGKLLKPENGYFIGIFLAFFQPIVGRIKKERSGLFFKKSRDRSKFETSFTVFVAHHKRPSDNQLGSYYRWGHRVLSGIFRVLLKMEQINQKEVDPDKRWPNLLEHPAQVIVEEPEYKRKFGK